MSNGSQFQSQDSKDNATVAQPADAKPDDKFPSPQVTLVDADSPSGHASGAAFCKPRASVSRNGNPEESEVSSTDEVRVCSDGGACGGSTGNTSTIDRIEPESKRKVKRRDAETFSGSDSKSLLLEFDEYVAAERNSERDLGYGFEVGDMVWGKVKSHPWWPGHIYNEAFATGSVRRSKREGHVLVAFFGDSSYGWFEPAELIPFDPYFAEKSQQINSRSFLRAVEEAVDEASRRRGLGLTCKCRSPDSFRPTDIHGYFSVDVPDYEPGGFYSYGQITKARDSFNPIETLHFVRQLALAPHYGEHGDIVFVKNKATVSAYRKAVFEQYDETYAQAFGVQRSRPSRPQDIPPDQTSRQPPRAPLSGPMVIAEALGGGKSATKSVKVKDNSKKDKYLFKQRDDPSKSFDSAHREETPDAAGHYVFQKRAPVAPHNLEKHANKGFAIRDDATSTSDAKEALIGQVQVDSSGLTSQTISLDAKPHPDTRKESSEEKTASFERDMISSKNTGRSDLSGELVLQSTIDETSQSSHLESKTYVNVEHDWHAKLSEPSEEFKQTEQGLLTIPDGVNAMHQAKGENKAINSPVEGKHRGFSALKKIKGHKRPVDDLNSKTIAIEKKKKKKKDMNLQPTSNHLEKHSTSGKSIHLQGNLTEKPAPTISAPIEGFQPEQVQLDAKSRNLLTMDTVGDVNFEVPLLLGDLQALALNPFHGIERKIPAVVLQFFLRFRSRVYQKSLVLSPPTENEAPEVCVTKPPLGFRISDIPADHIKASPLVKPLKHVRPNDPTKSGRKREPSDRQEEIAAKRLKKIKDIKALAADKAASSQKASEAWREDMKEPASELLKPEAPSRLVKPGSAKKVDCPAKAKAVEPTTLVIKFPPQTSLPSVAELKARFARFGPMDQSGFRIFWKSSTCRVVFLHKADAQAAYKFSVTNQSLFGGVGVRCFLRESGDSAPEVSEAAKVRGDGGSTETPRVKDTALVQHQTSVSSQKLLPQPTIQLKSCLKKSTGDESGQVTGNGSIIKGNPRVKFILGGEESSSSSSSSRGEQLMVGNKNNCDSSFTDGGAPPIAMDFNSKNVPMVTSQPPLLPLPVVSHATQFTKIPQHNLRNTELAMAPRNSLNFINTTVSDTAPPVDISQQMIILLTRCSDVVTNLTGVLGYVPYHPL